MGLGAGEVVKVLGALAVVIGLATLVRIMLKRTGPAWQASDRPSGVVEILARYPLARGQHLLVLKLARRILLLHQSGSTMTTLSELIDADEVAALLARMEAGSSGRSAEKFKQVLRGFESDHDLMPEIRTVRTAARLEPSMSKAGEIIDLTRSQMRGLGGLLGRKAGRGQ